jgi:hypothetical protein
MWNRYSILAAATLTVGSMALADNPTNPPMTNSTAAPAVQPANGVEKEAEDILSTNGVQQAAAQLAQAAVSGNLKDISQYICEADRQRIENASTSQSPDQKLAQFRQDWHQKYGSEFSIPDAVAVLTDPNVQIQSGDLGDQARTAGEKIPADTKTDNAAHQQNDNGNSLTSNAPSAANQPGATGAGKNNVNGAVQKNAIADANLTAPPSATIIIPSNHGLPTVTARFVNESEQWKIDIPNNMDAQKLQQNLDDELGRLDDQKASWSDDPKQAQLTVVHAVLAAMTDAQNISETGQSSSPGSTPH